MTADTRSFVLFPLGRRRFALPAENVAELARKGQLHAFPHRTPGLLGVVVRRGRIVPVWHIAETLTGPDSVPGRFYLLASRTARPRPSEWTAIPVNGECELLNAELLPPTGQLNAYVQGLLSLPGEIVEVLDLEKLGCQEAIA